MRAAKRLTYLAYRSEISVKQSTCLHKTNFCQFLDASVSPSVWIDVFVIVFFFFASSFVQLCGLRPGQYSSRLSVK